MDRKKVWTKREFLDEPNDESCISAAAAHVAYPDEFWTDTHGGFTIVHCDDCIHIEGHTRKASEELWSRPLGSEGS